jgi:lipopolysaccharide export system permease protein
MRLLDRYIFREMMVPFLVGSVALVLMFQANTLIAFMKTYATQNVPPLAIFQLLMLKTPDFLKYTLPSTMALASSLAISRLARESELTAMRSAGASIRRVVMPVAAFGLIVAIANFIIIDRVQPAAETKFKDVASKAMILGASPEFVSNIFLKAGPRTMVYFGAANRLQNGSTQVRDVMIVEQLEQGKLSFLTSDVGMLDKGIWTFETLYMRVFQNRKLIQFEVQKDATIDLKKTVEDMFSSATPTELSLQMLKDQIKSEREAGRDVRRLETEFFSRYALPFACFVMAVTGPVFAVRFGRSGGFVGILLAVMLMWAYYNVYIISTEIFGKNGWLPPIAAAWFPNVLFAVLAVIGIRRLE